jgi:hypothetical protein
VDVLGDELAKLGEFWLIQQLETIDDKRILLAQRYRRTPFLPSVRPAPGIKRSAQQSDYNALLVHIIKSKSISVYLA